MLDPMVVQSTLIEFEIFVRSTGSRSCPCFLELSNFPKYAHMNLRMNPGDSIEDRRRPRSKRESRDRASGKCIFVEKCAAQYADE